MADVVTAGRRDLTLYRRLVGARIRGDFQYRASFVLYLLGQALASGLDLLSIVVIFGRVDELAGWSGVEVVALYAVASTAFGIADAIVSPVERIADHVKAGTFDKFLVRPASPLTQLCGEEFQLRRLGRIAQPAVVLAIVLPRLDVEWTVPAALLVPLAIASGTTIYGATWVVTSSIAFWTVETQEIANSFTYGGVTLSEYPVDVFSRWLQRLVVFVIPLAFTAYLPVAWLLDRPVVGGVSSNAAWAAPFVAAALASLASVVFRSAVRHYRSTGS